MAERSHENVKVLHSWSYFKFLKRKETTVERLQSLAAEDGALYHVSAKQIFWSGGCKNFVQAMSPEIAGYSDTGKSFPYDMIIGRVVLKSVFFL